MDYLPDPRTIKRRLLAENAAVSAEIDETTRDRCQCDFNAPQGPPLESRELVLTHDCDESEFHACQRRVRVTRYGPAQANAVTVEAREWRRLDERGEVVATMDEEDPYWHRQVWLPKTPAASAWCARPELAKIAQIERLSDRVGQIRRLAGTSGCQQHAARAELQSQDLTQGATFYGWLDTGLQKINARNEERRRRAHQALPDDLLETLRTRTIAQLSQEYGIDPRNMKKHDVVSAAYDAVSRQHYDELGADDPEPTAAELAAISARLGLEGYQIDELKTIFSPIGGRRGHRKPEIIRDIASRVWEIEQIHAPAPAIPPGAAPPRKRSARAE